MATYYWTGKVSSNVQDANNWSLWGPSSGITLPVSAPSKPVDNSDIVFAKYPSTFPIYGPAGFLSGTSGGTAAVTIATLQVKEDFNKDIGTSSNYFKFFAKEVDLNRSSGYTLAFLELTPNPSGITIGEEPHSIVSIKAATSGVSYYIKGTASSVVVPSVIYNTFAKIYLYNLTSTFTVLNNNSKDQLYLNSTTINPIIYNYNGVDITNDFIQVVSGSPTINVEQGYQSISPITLLGNGVVMNLTQTGISGSNPLDLPYTLFTTLNVGTVGSGPNTINSYHETFIEKLNIQNGSINFNDPSTVSIISSGNFYSDKAVLTTSSNNNLEIANLTIKNITGNNTPNIKLYGNYDITAYPNNPLG